MPLEILLALVVGGIAAIAALTHVFGLSRRALFADAEEARAAWRRAFPDDAPRGVTLLSDGRAALVETARGLGIVWTLGADTVARHLDGAAIERRGDRLVLRFPDWGAPRVALRVTEAEARALFAQLEETAWARM